MKDSSNGKRQECYSSQSILSSLLGRTADPAAAALGTALLADSPFLLPRPWGFFLSCGSYPFSEKGSIAFAAKLNSPTENPYLTTLPLIGGLTGGLNYLRQDLSHRDITSIYNYYRLLMTTTITIV